MGHEPHRSTNLNFRIRNCCSGSLLHAFKVGTTFVSHIGSCCHCFQLNKGDKSSLLVGKTVRALFTVNKILQPARHILVGGGWGAAGGKNER